MAVTTKTQIKLTFLYEYGLNRTYTITKKNSESGYAAYVLKQRIGIVNANMPDYFAQTFISDEHDYLEKISDAQYITTQEEVIYGHQ